MRKFYQKWIKGECLHLCILCKFKRVCREAKWWTK